MSFDDKHLEPLYKILGHSFGDPGLLMQALTHPSLGGTQNYQRLEFVGDRVLGLVIARMLYERFPKIKEGGLAVRLAALVRKEALAEVAALINLDRFVRMSASAEGAESRGKAAIMADACEAVIGALYLDGGLDVAARFVVKHWDAQVISKTAGEKDAKSLLQEWAQAIAKPPPTYHEVGRTGPDHQPVFAVEARVEGVAPVTGQGTSKRLAEQAAAEILLKMIKDKRV